MLLIFGGLFGVAGGMLMAHDATGSDAAAAIAFGLGLLIELVVWRQYRECRDFRGNGHDRRAGVG